MEWTEVLKLQDLVNDANVNLESGIKEYLKQMITEKGSTEFEEMDGQKYLPLEDSVYSPLKTKNFGMGSFNEDIEIWGVFLDKDDNILVDAEGAFYYIDDVNNNDWLEIAHQAKNADKVLNEN